jgi:hypothetical protein
MTQGYNYGHSKEPEPCALRRIQKGTLSAFAVMRSLAHDLSHRLSPVDLQMVHGFQAAYNPRLDFVICKQQG